VAQCLFTDFKTTSFSLAHRGFVSYSPMNLGLIPPLL
jgi:hypothetical protein